MFINRNWLTMRRPLENYMYILLKLSYLFKEATGVYDVNEII